MISLLNKHPWLAVVIIFLALGIAGTIDFADAKLQEKIACGHNPKPSYCQ